MNIENLEYLIEGESTLIWIETEEYKRCIDKISQLSEQLNKKIFFLESDSSIEDINGECTDDCLNIPDFLEDKEDVILILKDYHEELKDSQKRRELTKIVENNDGNSVIIISPVLDIPLELKKYITVLTLELPNTEELKNTLKEIKKANVFSGECENLSIEDEEKICKLGLGLTEFEFRNAINMSIIKNKEILPDFIFEQKKQCIEKSGTMKVYNSEEGFSSLIGLDNLKAFAKKMALSGQGKGVLILGVPGCGKTQFAKALGKETDRLTVSLDFGDLMGAYVGQTENNTKEAFKIIDTISPSILFIDEIEKGLSGVSEDGDSGVSKRQGGKFLKWLQDKSSDTYVVATANNVRKLPSEFLRSGRWDGIFFIDVPSKETQVELLKFYKEKFNIDKSDKFEIERDMYYTGAEIETLCRLAKSLSVSLTEANNFVCPIYKNKGNEIINMRKEMKKHFIMVNN